jgi:hypothetical protein
MEFLTKVAIYLALVFAFLACNLWIIGTAVRGYFDSGVVVAPVKVVGGTGDAALAGDALARLIIARLQTLEWDLRESQSSLRSDKQAAAATPVRGVAAGIMGTPKTAVLDTKLFETANIELKVAGVDVGGWLPSIQRWFVQDRILTFAVSWDGTSATIAGNVDALGLGAGKPLSLSIKNATVNSIADAVALGVIHRRWADKSPEFGGLSEDEFSRLVTSINETARINRRVIAYREAAKADFEKVLETIGPLADRMISWNELSYFAASVAESAEKLEQALLYYRRLMPPNKPPLDLKLLQSKIAELEALAATTGAGRDQVALKRMNGYVADATRILNGLFGLNLRNVKLQLIPDTERNAYWDGQQVKVPATVQDLPDIVYHEASLPFVELRSSFKYADQEGALAQSYTDVLTSLIKQKLTGQTAQSADWIIAPGAMAWIEGKPDPADRRPLRSLKAPEETNQPSHFSKLVKLPNTATGDFGGIHVNSGIPNRAFYETAMRIGSDDAGKIWIASLDQFKPGVDLRGGAQAIYDTAKRMFGDDIKQAQGVKAGFETTGLL